MFKNITQFLKKFKKSEKEESKSTAKERLHLVLAQDRANISADFLEMMKQEILEVIKKYIDIDEKAIDVRLTNKEGEDGKVGAPALYANIPIITIKNEARKLEGTLKKQENNIEEISKKSEITVDANTSGDETNKESIEKDGNVNNKEEIVKDSQASSTQTPEIKETEETSKNNSNNNYKMQDNNTENANLKKEESYANN